MGATRTCQACGGYGGGVEPVLDDGSGPRYDCDFCNGTGEMTNKQVGVYLMCCRQDKQMAREAADFNIDDCEEVTIAELNERANQ